MSALRNSRLSPVPSRSAVAASAASTPESCDAHHECCRSRRTRSCPPGNSEDGQYRAEAADALPKRQFVFLQDAFLRGTFMCVCGGALVGCFLPSRRRKCQAGNFQEGSLYCPLSPADQRPGNELRWGQRTVQQMGTTDCHGLTQMGTDDLIRNAGTPPPFPDFLFCA